MALLVLVAHLTTLLLLSHVVNNNSAQMRDSCPDHSTQAPTHQVSTLNSKPHTLCGYPQLATAHQQQVHEVQNNISRRYNRVCRHNSN